MKLLFATIAVVLFSGVFAVAAAQNGKQVKVQVGQEKKAVGSGLRIKFVELVEDSRCPEDTECIWAGNAKIKIQVRNGRSAARTFDLNTNVANTSVKYAGYDIQLTDLTPHPRTNIRINRNGYVAVFTVKRLSKTGR